MISNRLKEIASFVDKNSVVFDVGTDHAQLPIFLLESGICLKAYAGDNKQGPLNCAKQNIARAGLSDKIITVLSDGLPLNIDDIDTVTICGMGYHTIEHILDSCDITKYKHFIIQANNEVPLLRKYISDHHYLVEDEKVIHDDFYYEIIKFSPKYGDSLNDLQLKYGPILLKNRDSIFLEYLKYKHDKLLRVNIEANKQEYRDTISEIEDILYNI